MGDILSQGHWTDAEFPVKVFALLQTHTVREQIDVLMWLHANIQLKTVNKITFPVHAVYSF